VDSIALDYSHVAKRVWLAAASRQSGTADPRLSRAGHHTYSAIGRLLCRDDNSAESEASRRTRRRHQRI